MALALRVAVRSKSSVLTICVELPTAWFVVHCSTLRLRRPATWLQSIRPMWWPGGESNHRHADFQSGVGVLLALYFNKLAGRPLPKLHHDAGPCRASSRKIHAAHSSLVTVESDWKIGSTPRLLGGAPKAMSGRCSPYSLGNAACATDLLSNPA